MLVGRGVLLDAGDAAGAGDRGDVVSPGEDPRERGLRGGCADLRADRADLVDEREVAAEVLPGEAGVGLAPVVVGEVVDGADLPGEQAVAERRVGDEADPELAQQRQDLRLHVAGPQRVLGLKRGDRLHGVCAADGLGGCLGEAEVQHLALGDQVGDGLRGLLDRGVRVDAVLVEQVDVVGAQALERPFDRGLDVRGTAVDHAGAAAGVGDEPELRGDLDLVAAALDGLADDLLTQERPVDLGGVDVGDTELEGTVDGADRLRVVQGALAGVGAGHGHRAEADAGDLKGPEVCVLHGAVLRCRGRER